MGILVLTNGRREVRGLVSGPLQHLKQQCNRGSLLFK